MSAPPKPKSNKKLLLAVVVALVVIGVVAVPPLLAGGFMVPVSKVTFQEKTESLTTANAQVTVQTMTAYEYYFTVRSGGMVRTSESDVSTSRGTANITMSLELTSPSNQTIDLGNANISGAMGTRDHTIYLSVDQGVHVPGTYRLRIIITANIAPVSGLLQLNLQTTVTVNFTVS